MLPAHRWGCCCCSTCCPDTRWSWQSCPQRGRMLSPRSHGGCPRLTWRRSAADRGQSRKTGLSPRNGRCPGGTGRQRSLSPKLGKVTGLNWNNSVLSFSSPCHTPPRRRLSGPCPARSLSCPGAPCRPPRCASPACRQPMWSRSSAIAVSFILSFANMKYTLCSVLCSQQFEQAQQFIAISKETCNYIKQED